MHTSPPKNNQKLIDGNNKKTNKKTHKQKIEMIQTTSRKFDVQGRDDPEPFGCYECPKHDVWTTSLNFGYGGWNENQRGFPF